MHKVVEQEIIALYVSISLEKVEAHIAELFETNETANQISKTLLTSTEIMEPVRILPELATNFP